MLVTGIPWPSIIRRFQLTKFFSQLIAEDFARLKFRAYAVFHKSGLGCRDLVNCGKDCILIRLVAVNKLLQLNLRLLCCGFQINLLELLLFFNLLELCKLLISSTSLFQTLRSWAMTMSTHSRITTLAAEFPLLTTLSLLSTHPVLSFTRLLKRTGFSLRALFALRSRIIPGHCHAVN